MSAHERQGEPVPGLLKTQPLSGFGATPGPAGEPAAAPPPAPRDEAVTIASYGPEGVEGPAVEPTFVPAPPAPEPRIVVRPTVEPPPAAPAPRAPAYDPLEPQSWWPEASPAAPAPAPPTTAPAPAPSESIVAPSRSTAADGLAPESWWQPAVPVDPGRPPGATDLPTATNPNATNPSAAHPADPLGAVSPATSPPDVPHAPTSPNSNPPGPASPRIPNDNLRALASNPASSTAGTPNPTATPANAPASTPAGTPSPPRAADNLRALTSNPPRPTANTPNTASPANTNPANPPSPTAHPAAGPPNPRIPTDNLRVLTSNPPSQTASQTASQPASQTAGQTPNPATGPAVSPRATATAAGGARRADGRGLRTLDQVHASPAEMAVEPCPCDGDERPPSHPHVWLGFLLVGVVASFAALAAPATGRPILYASVLLAPAVAIVAGCWLHKPPTPPVWYVLAAGHVALAVAAFFPDRLPASRAPGAVTVAAVAGVVADALFVAGLAVLIRQRNRRRDLPSVIDALTMLVGTGFVFWVCLMAPYAHDPHLTLLTRSLALGRPALDVLLLSVVARLALDTGRRTAALHLGLTAYVVLFATHCLQHYSLLSGGADNALLLRAGGLAFAVLWGAAALHPSIRESAEPDAAAQVGLSSVRLAAIAVAVLLAPGVQLMAWFGGRTIDVPVLVAPAVALLMLVVARLSVTVRVHQQAEARERSLREAGASLAAAATIDSTYQAIMGSAVEMAGEVRLRLLIVDDDAFRVVATNGDRMLIDRKVTKGLLGRQRYDALVAGRVLQRRSDRSLAAHLDLGGAIPSVVILPLAVQDRLVGALLLASKIELPSPVIDGLSALSFQIALALEAAALAEDLHRQSSEAWFKSLIQHASDVVTVIDTSAIVTFQSSSAEPVFGWIPESWVGRSVLERLHPEDITGFTRALSSGAGTPGHPSSFEWRWFCADGTWIYAETRWTDLRDDPNVNGIVLNTRDVTERRAFEAQLQRQAFHDGITDLANRALFHDRVEHALSREQRTEQPISVLFIDLDDFKTVNDSLGHAAGDELLRLVADRLRDLLRTSDTAARLGGDEFAVLLEEGGVDLASEVGERMLEEFAAPFNLEGRELFVHASIGIASSNMGRAGTETADTLLRDADAAMYMAKSLGKDRVELFEPAMHDNVLKRLELKAEMERGSDDGEFALYYQPIIELSTGRLSGLEALVRWNHPRHGLVNPNDFIPLAEETGLIIPIGRWCLIEACRRLPAIHALYPADPPVTMAINLSGKQVQHPEIVQDVRAALAGSGVDPSCITLEITESVMMEDTEFAVRRLNELKDLGVRLAIDDFGTGFSSLNSLRNFPVDILKVDRSFTSKLHSSPKDSAVVNAILELARILKMKPVAEGIEDLEQLDQLTLAGCTYGQGFLLAKPMNDVHLELFLAERHATRAAGESELSWR
ncbi:MAG: putative diguanylate cyclase/phosphodiesterase with sensor [Acidimicrobiales bacterium]|nr:putative diguanylate cyclase/phosphodiesterase with sensor [Acidimicrobiales bacterium]